MPLGFAAPFAAVFLAGGLEPLPFGPATFAGFFLPVVVSADTLVPVARVATARFDPAAVAALM